MELNSIILSSSFHFFVFYVVLLSFCFFSASSVSIAVRATSIFSNFSSSSFRFSLADCRLVFDSYPKEDNQKILKQHILAFTPLP